MDENRRMQKQIPEDHLKNDHKEDRPIGEMIVGNHGSDTIP